jgi:uncharacterized coiled-coil protein SlyX
MTEASHIEQRLKHVEEQVRHQGEAVDVLHQDSIRTQGAIASIATHIDNLTDTMRSIEAKLDEHRTRKPELAGLAAVAAVILTIVGGLGLVVFDRMDMVNSAVQRHEVVIDIIRSSRFTKEDGHRLEDKIDDHCRNTK